jgi:hypothetical protein
MALPLLAISCAAVDNTGSDFYLAARNCRTLAAYKPTVRLNRGGIADLEMDAGYDDSRYADCMNAQGWTPKIIDKTKQAVADCHVLGLRQTAATQQGADPHLKPELDTTAFEQCLRDRGLESEVLIEPLQPAAPLK